MSEVRAKNAGCDVSKINANNAADENA